MLQALRRKQVQGIKSLEEDVEHTSEGGGGGETAMTVDSILDRFR